MFLNVRGLISISVLLILMGFLGLADQDRFAAHAAILESTSNTEAVDSAVGAFQEIGTLRNADPVDGNAIRSVYVNSLQAMVQQVDADHGLTLDGDLLAAIDEINSGNETFLAVQVIDKTLQRVFYLTILDRVTAVRDDFETASTESLTATWDEAEAAFEAIRGTAARDNKVITADRQSIETGNNPALDVQIAAAFARGRTALNKQNPTEDLIEIKIARQIIRLSLVRAYYIGVLREVEGIVSNRDRDIAEAREKQKEGEIFYRILEEFIIRENATGSEFIKAQMTGNITDVDADTVVSELSKGFIGRVRAELSANESSISDDRGRAMEVAEEALLYAGNFLDDFEIRLDSTSRAALENALNDLIVASSASDAAGAEQARQRIEDQLIVYEETLSIISEYQPTTSTPFVDAAVSAFQEIGLLRRQNPVDAQAILEAYNGELQQLTQIIDSLYGTSMDSDVLSAIDDITSGQPVALAVQAIDKTLQRVFALTIYNRVTFTLNRFADLAIPELELEWDRAYSAFQAVIGTAARENKVLTADRQAIESGSNPLLDSRITLAFIQGKAVINGSAAGEADQLAIERERIIAPLARGFFIGVLREIEGIVGNRERDLDEALEKQVEGIYFYRIVDSALRLHSPSSHTLVQSQLDGNVFDVDADLMVSEISKGLIELVTMELTRVEQSLGTDRTQARLAAEIAALYTEIFLPDLGLRLDATKRVKIENALQDLVEASENSDQDKAQTALQTLNDLISDYQNELR